MIELQFDKIHQKKFNLVKILEARFLSEIYVFSILKVNFFD